MPNVVDRLGGASSSLAFKAPCRLATTTNITLSGYQSVDGTLPTSSEHVDLRRILVKNQTSTAENGIYIMDTGTWERAKDFDSVNDIRQGTRIYVFGGSTQSGTYIVTSSVDPSTFAIDTTGITIAEAGTFDQTTSALGIASGGVISFNSGDVTITHSSSALAFAGAGAGFSFAEGVTASSALTVSGAFTASSAVAFSAGLTSTSIVAGTTASVLYDPTSTNNNSNVQSHAAGASAGMSAGRFSADSAPPRMVLLKSRNAAIGSHTVVQDGDSIGEIRASGSDGTIFSQAATILFQVDGTPGSSDMPGRISLRVSPDGSATPSELLRVGNSGVLVSSAFTSTGLITGNAGLSVQSTFTSSGNIYAVTGTTITAGGVTGRGILLYGSTTFGIYAGSGAPTIAAGQGSFYMRTDGASSLTRAYIQTSGSTNTWVGMLTTG